jgi:MFS family permease
MADGAALLRSGHSTPVKAVGTSRLQGNIWKLYVMHVLGHAHFHLVINTLFLLAKGFSAREFFLAQSAQALAILVMEVPTGVISDRMSRKWSLVAASVIGLPTIPAIILSDSFYVVLGAMAVNGIAGALVSGTDVSMLYDTLLVLGREDEFQRIQGRIAWYRSISMAVAGIAGGVLAQYDMATAWWAFFAASVLALPVRLSLREPPFRESAEQESYMRHLGQSIATSFTGDASYFVLYSAVVWLFFRLGFWLWQPFLQLINVPVAFFGPVYAATNLAYGLVSRQAHVLEQRVGIRTSLLLIPAVLAAVFLLQSQTTQPAASVLIVAHAAISGAFSILLEALINQRIPSERRATVLSIKNMLNSVLFITLSPLLGHVVDMASLPRALALLGVSLGIIGLLFGVWARRTPKRVTAA